MLLEPMYLLMGRSSQHDQASYGLQACPVEDATSVIFASEPLSESGDDWSEVAFGEIVFLEKKGATITRNVSSLKV
jgi:glutamine amidotransferase